MNKPGISLQLWSVRDDFNKDFAKTMEQVAKIGFKAVETSGFGNLTPTEGAKAIIDSGLTVSGMHVSIYALRTNLDGVISEAYLLKATDIILPYYPKELFTSASAIQSLGEELNTIGSKLRAYGLQFHYHHHDSEMKVVEGRRIMNWILDSSEPRNLLCQADMYWVQIGGSNPAKFIHEQGSRIQIYHLKDETELGTGPVNHTEVFAAAEHVGAVRWYVIEVERYNFPPIESVRKSFEKLKSWGK